MAHLSQAHGHIAFGGIQTGGIAGGHSRDVFPDHLPHLNEDFQPLIQALPLHADERSGGRQQLILGQKHMAVVRIVLQLKHQRRLHPLGIISRHP